MPFSPRSIYEFYGELAEGSCRDPATQGGAEEAGLSTAPDSSSSTASGFTAASSAASGFAASSSLALGPAVSSSAVAGPSVSASAIAGIATSGPATPGSPSSGRSSPLFVRSSPAASLPDDELPSPGPVFPNFDTASSPLSILSANTPSPPSFEANDEDDDMPDAVSVASEADSEYVRHLEDAWDRFSTTHPPFIQDAINCNVGDRFEVLFSTGMGRMPKEPTWWNTTKITARQWAGTGHMFWTMAYNDRTIIVRGFNTTVRVFPRNFFSTHFSKYDRLGNCAHPATQLLTTYHQLHSPSI